MVPGWHSLSPSPWFEAHRTFAESPVSSLPAWSGRTPGASLSPAPLRSLSAVEESRQTKGGYEDLVPSILQRTRITSLFRLGTAGMISKDGHVPNLTLVTKPEVPVCRDSWK